MKCLLLTNDLLFGTQAAQAVRDAGYEVQALGVSDAENLSSEMLGEIGLVLADLTMPRFDAQQVGERLRATIRPTPHLIAVGPHVQRAKLDAASGAGWRVYTRGQFHSSASSILRSLAPTA